MKYKVGDKVKIKSLNWYENSKKDDYGIRCEKNYFTPKMAKFCSKEATIEALLRYCYLINIDGGEFNWDDEMFEEPKKKCKHKNKKNMREVKVFIHKCTDGTYEGIASESINGYRICSHGNDYSECVTRMIDSYSHDLEKNYGIRLVCEPEKKNEHGNKKDIDNMIFKKIYPSIGHTQKVPNTDAEIFKSITDKMLETFIAKNHDYGGSFEKGCNEDGLVSARTRLRDKWERFKKLSSGELAQVKDESIRDTLLDLSNYCIMTVMWLDKKKNLEDKK